MCWIPDPRDSVRKSVQPRDINVTVRDSVRPVILLKLCVELVRPRRPPLL